MKNKKVLLGIILFIVIIGAIIIIKQLGDSDTGSVLSGKLTTVYVATGGGKEDFLNDKEVKKILKNKYKLFLIITLCGSTYAKFVCSTILKQPSNFIWCSKFIEFKRQAHSILEIKSLLIGKSFFTTLIISHHPFFFNKKATKKSTFYS